VGYVADVSEKNIASIFSVEEIVQVFENSDPTERERSWGLGPLPSLKLNKLCFFETPKTQSISVSKLNHREKFI